MKKRLFAFILLPVLAFIVLLAGCGGTIEDSASETEEDQVRSCVEAWGRKQMLFGKIGDNELKSSSVTITYVNKDSENKYTVSGKITMVDIYNDRWTNKFNCTVENIGGWSVEDYDYVNSGWSKS